MITRDEIQFISQHSTTGVPYNFPYLLFVTELKLFKLRRDLTVKLVSVFSSPRNKDSAEGASVATTSLFVLYLDCTPVIPSLADMMYLSSSLKPAVMLVTLLLK